MNVDRMAKMAELSRTTLVIKPVLRADYCRRCLSQAIRLSQATGAINRLLAILPNHVIPKRSRSFRWNRSGGSLAVEGASIGHGFCSLPMLRNGVRLQELRSFRRNLIAGH